MFGPHWRYVSNLCPLSRDRTTQVKVAKAVREEGSAARQLCPVRIHKCRFLREGCDTRHSVSLEGREVLGILHWETRYQTQTRCPWIRCWMARNPTSQTRLYGQASDDVTSSRSCKRHTTCGRSAINRHQRVGDSETETRTERGRTGARRMNSRFRTEEDVMDDLARLCRLDCVFQFRGQERSGQGGRGRCRVKTRSTVVPEFSGLSGGGRERLCDLEERS